MSLTRLLVAVKNQTNRRNTLTNGKCEIYKYCHLMYFSKASADALMSLYNAIKTRCSEHFTVEQKRDVVRDKALTFQDTIVTLCGDESVTYYVHSAVHHLPAQVVACPVDIVDSSGSGIEHINSVVRSALRYVY